MVHVVEALDQLDETGLAGSRRTDQPDALSAGNIHVQVLEQRLVLSGVVEGDVLEAHRSVGYADCLGTGAIGDAERLVVQLYQFLHLVHRTLQHVDMLTDVAEISVEHEVAGDHIGDISGAGLSLHPEP